jgi:hypothetical protein
MRRLPLLMIGLVLLASACSSGGSDGAASPDYTPVPDDEIFATIQGLPGVERADVSYNDTFPAHSYLATITVSAGADAQSVLDTIYAKLWQGRKGADITLEAQQNGAVVRLDAFGGRPTSRAELTRRYGEQPGDGSPPTG